MSEMWRVIDDSGATHEVEASVVDGCRRKTTIGTATGTNSDYVSTQYPTRAAVAMTAGWQFIAVAEVLAPGQVSREEMAAEVAHLEARRGALLAEIDRLAARGRVTWGAMPTVAEVKEHARRGGLWATRDATLPDELVTLDVRKGKVVFRRTNGKAWCALIIASGQWRAITGEEVARG